MKKRGPEKMSKPEHFYTRSDKVWENTLSKCFQDKGFEPKVVKWGNYSNACWVPLGVALSSEMRTPLSCGCREGTSHIRGFGRRGAERPSMSAVSVICFTGEWRSQSPSCTCCFSISFILTQSVYQHAVVWGTVFWTPSIYCLFKKC